jgi:hypothetical protein
MPRKNAKSDAIRIVVAKPVTLRFKTKSGRTVSFKALKTVEKTQTVKALRTVEETHTVRSRANGR